jgi:hypothetical protein
MDFWEDIAITYGCVSNSFFWTREDGHVALEEENILVI